jgi:hypothetical protein
MAAGLKFQPLLRRRQGRREMDLIGTGFHHLMDSVFWYLTFASVRQGKYVMDKARIAQDEWMSKRDDLRLAEEHKTPGARESLKEGLKHWLTTDLYKERRSKIVAVPTSTKPIIVEDE